MENNGQGYKFHRKYSHYYTNAIVCVPKVCVRSACVVQYLFFCITENKPVFPLTITTSTSKCGSGYNLLKTLSLNRPANIWVNSKSDWMIVLNKVRFVSFCCKIYLPEHWIHDEVDIANILKCNFVYFFINSHSKVLFWQI